VEWSHRSTGHAGGGALTFVAQVHLHLQSLEVFRCVGPGLPAHLLARPLLEAIEFSVDIHGDGVILLALQVRSQGEDKKGGMTAGERESWCGRGGGLSSLVGMSVYQWFCAKNQATFWDKGICVQEVLLI
jgi:hypothetical protein